MHFGKRYQGLPEPFLAQVYNEMHGLIVGVGKNYCRNHRHSVTNALYRSSCLGLSSGVRSWVFKAIFCLNELSAPQFSRSRLVLSAARNRCGRRQTTPGVLIGTAVRPSQLSESAYASTLAREFNMVEAEDAMKWWVLRPDKDTYDFRQADEVVRFAQSHQMKVRGHCLVWGRDNPIGLRKAISPRGSCRGFCTNTSPG